MIHPYLTLEQSLENGHVYNERPLLHRLLQRVPRSDTLDLAEGVEIVTRGKNTARALHEAGWQPERIAEQLAAVYLANADYLGLEERSKQQRIRVQISRSGDRASHRLTAPFEHRINIPLRYFSTIGNLIFALDAETRHAVHTDILSSMRAEARPDDWAERSYGVIAETIDAGSASRYRSRRYAQQRDPYVNDFFLDENEDGGHSGAQFVRQHLSQHPAQLRKQLRWLARLPPRQNPWPILGEVKPALRGFVLPTFQGELTHTAPNGTTVVFANHPYDVGARYLAGLYLDREYPWSFLDAAADIRRKLIATCPYEVPGRAGVKLGDKLITTFASQLDYVVLKLAYTPPRELATADA